MQARSHDVLGPRNDQRLLLADPQIVVSANLRAVPRACLQYH